MDNRVAALNAILRKIDIYKMDIANVFQVMDTLMIKRKNVKVSYNFYKKFAHKIVSLVAKLTIV